MSNTAGDEFIPIRKTGFAAKIQMRIKVSNKKKTFLTIFRKVLAEMLLSIVLTVWRWISSFLVFDHVRQPTDDLEETARQEIRVKLAEIRSRKDEVDARTYEPESIYDYERPTRNVFHLQGPYVVSVPESVDSFIAFHSHEIIQSSPEFIFAGTFLKQKKVAIKKIGSDDLQLEQEMLIADLLKHHENFLPHFFGFNQKGENFVATEYYVETLNCFDNISSSFCKLDVKNVLSQICNALEFLHDSGIAHGCLSKQNIAVILRGNEPVFKITNFRDAVKTIREEAFNQDVQGLGFILLDLLSKQKMQADLQDKPHPYRSPSLSDENLCLNLVDKMTVDDLKNRMTVKQVKSHPYLWTAHETLHFIVQLVKMLEAKNNETFEKELKKVSCGIFPDDWRGYVDPSIIDELKSINFGRLPFGNIFGLVKTIRNLVRYSK